MRKTSTRKFPAWVIIYVLFFLLICIPASQTEVRAGGQCVDGTYSHMGWECCRCGVGLKLVEHCTTNLEYGKCEPCDPGKFSSHPSSENTCESCKSCTHPNENLEEEQPCTASSNTKCRCKKDHYCPSSIEVCQLCHPCTKCGAEGIKIPCAGNNNTVCNEKIKDEIGAGEIVGIVIGIFALLVIVASAVYLWKKKRQQNKAQQPNGNTQNEEMQHLNIPDVGIQPLIPEIATAVGWKDMRNVAMQSGILKTKIENCEQDHQGDREEQTIQLLQIWAEEVGRGAPEKLINMLKESGKKAKAEVVTKIVWKAASNLA